MGREKVSGSSRSDAEWVHDLHQVDSSIQQAAFTNLGYYLRFHIFNDIRRRARSLSALASFDQGDLETLADDIVQEALIRIHNKLEQYTGKGKFLNFALVIARRILIDEFRKKHWTTVSLAPQRAASEQDESGRPPHSLEDLPDPKQLSADAGVILREMAQIAYDAIQHDLSESQARAFIGAHFYEMSGDEIALLLGKSRMAVDQLTFQARKKIKRRLHKYGYTIEDL